MLPNLTVKQHINHAIRQWEFVRDTKFNKWEYLNRNNLKTPENGCYLCEVYQHDNATTILDVPYSQTHCKKCPLSPNGEYCYCQVKGPYLNYDEDFENVDIYAGEIVEIIKAHKKKINL